MQIITCSDTDTLYRQPVSLPSHTQDQAESTDKSALADQSPRELPLGICSCSMGCYHPREHGHIPYCMYCDPRHCPMPHGGCCCPCAMCYPDSDAGEPAETKPKEQASPRSVTRNTRRSGRAPLGGTEASSPPPSARKYGVWPHQVMGNEERRNWCADFLLANEERAAIRNRRNKTKGEQAEEGLNSTSSGF